MDKKPQKGHAPFETPMVLCCFVRWGRSRPWAWRGHIDGVSHLWGVPAPLAGFPSIARASSLVACGRFPATVDQVDQKGPKRREKRALSKRFHRWELLPHFLCCCDGATPVQRLPCVRGAVSRKADKGLTVKGCKQSLHHGYAMPPPFTQGRL